MERNKEEVKGSITSTKASKEIKVCENNSSALNASTTNNINRIAEENKKFMSFDIKPVLEMIAGLNLTITETNHSGNLYTIKANDESELFSSKDFPMSVTVEVCPSCCVTLTVINQKNSRVFIHKRGCHIKEGFELYALDNLLWDMSCRTHDKIEKLRSKEMR